MKIVPLNSETKSLFWKYVENRLEEYFFFIMDLKDYANLTKIFIAIDNTEEIQGMSLIYKDKQVQIRGSETAAKILLENIDLRSKEITVLLAHKKLIYHEFIKNKKEMQLNRLTIHSGENIVYNQFDSEELKDSDREEIVQLYNKADPEYWGKVKSKDLIFNESHRWFGIKIDAQIVSFSQIWIGDDVGIISTVATHPDFQNRGYATSLVSYSLLELFKYSPLALIHVRADNASAVHTYQKVGFKVFAEYYNWRLT